MSCPHCQADIPIESEYCGVCGETIDSSSLFPLPISQNARIIRLGLILLLNVSLLAGGAYFIHLYLQKRDLHSPGTP